VLLLPSPAPARRLALLAAGLAALQVLLGVLTLRLALAEPLVTVGHQLIAALLIATLPAAALALRPSSVSEPFHG
jgi:cytochrome c oxidase assembly protein subunit 15